MFASLTSLIETGLKSMNESDFQKLSFDFLNFIGFNYISAPGAMVTANKTSPGTPDGFFEDNCGNFVFCEVTTLKRENSKSKFLEKLNDDVDHCFDEVKSGISNNEISTVILVFNSKILVDEIKDLRKKVKDINPNTRLILFSIQNLANFLQNFPNLGNYIPFAPTMDGIYSLNSFIENSSNGIRPDLKNEFIKQDELFNSLLDQLGQNDYLCLYGNQGTGKTRLAIEVAHEYSKINDYRLIVIKRYSPVLVSDIRKIVNSNKRILFVIDDYTDDFFNLSYFIEDVNNLYENSSFKFLFTLRKQFLNLIKQELKNYSQNIVQIDSLDNYHMKKFIVEFINNEDYYFLNQNIIVDRLIQLAKGNIVFCVMAMNIIAKEEDLSILDDSERVFVNYYYNYDKLMEVFYNNSLLKVLGIFSFFNVVDLKNEELLDLIQKLFKCKIPDNSNVDILLKYELLTMSHDKIYLEDSLLSTYIFYLTFIERNLFDFKEFIEFFIHYNPRLLYYKFADIFSSFDIDKFKMKYFNLLNDIKDNLSEDNDLMNFYSIFNRFYSEELLLFVINYYKECDGEDFNWDEFTIPNMRNYTSKNNVINLLFQSDKHKFVLEFALKLLYKKPSLFKDILFNIKQTYELTDFSQNEEYYLQNILLDVLNDYHDRESYCQLVSDIIFRFIITNLKFLEEYCIGGSIFLISDFIRFEVNVNFDEKLAELRKKVFGYLFKMHDEYPLFVEKSVESFINSFNESILSIIENEFDLIYSFLETLDYERYMPNKLAYLFKEKLDGCKISYNSNFEFINEDIIKQINVCSNSFNIHEIRCDVEINNNLIECIDKFGSQELLNIMNEIWSADKSIVYINSLFEILIESDIDDFLKTFEHYINSKFVLIGRANFIKKLFDSELNTLEIFNLINNEKILEKEIFYHSFFLNMPKDEITQELFHEFSNYLINMEDTNHYFHDLCDYWKYNPVFLEVREEIGATDTFNIIQYLTKILIKKSKDIPIRFSYTFCEDYKDYFKDNFELLKECYFNHCLSDSNYDSDFSELEVLCKIDKSFLMEYLEFRYENNLEFSYGRGNVGFVWQLDYNYQEIDDMITLMLEKFYPHDNGIYIFFPEFDDNKKEFINKFISKNYDDKQKMGTIFAIIKEYYPFNEYVHFLNLFLNFNHDCEIFRYLISSELLLADFNHRIRYWEIKVEFYEKIKDYVEDLDSIDYLEHIIVMKKLIHDTKLRLNDVIERNYF